ncbi:hypothetical protein Tco_0264205, partial [Tanacetum coccineum]
MVPNSEKLMEAFIGGLPQSIEGNVTASKPQTLEEAVNIAKRLMDQILKRNSVQETDDHKRKFEDKRNTNNDNNNYPNNLKKMEDEFYNLVVKRDDLKTYVRRFQELAVLCPNIVTNSEKLIE